jgi:phosphoribosylamine---glycine ligase
VTTRVVVLGSGGREHALAWRLDRSPHVDEIICAPGNPGMAELGECLPVRVDDPDAVAALADAVDADLVVIGAEDPAVAGVADALATAGRRCFGPSAAAARLEGSKAWMKDVVTAAGVPTARHQVFAEGDDARASAFLDSLPGAYVIKTDGLAAGKGVVVTESIDEARATVRAYLAGEAFGDAGRVCVIEEGLTGPEISVFALCDGTHAQLFAVAQDHKRAFDGDRGPNTGGMGAYSPVPFVSDDLVGDVMERIVQPTLAELRERGVEYRGALFCGLMVTADGPKLIEYNVRFGDPECQAMVPLLASDLYVHCREVADGVMETPVELSSDACVAVTLAAEGYPPAPTRRGDLISGVEKGATHEGVVVFHAGTKRMDGDVATNGGRVLTVTGVASTIRDARDRVYDAVADITWPGLHYRRDIAAQALA